MSLVLYFRSCLLSMFTPPPGPFEIPSLVYQFLSSPQKFVASYVYTVILALRGSSITPPTTTSRIRLVCISDTHTHRANIPNGDILIHAGDMCNVGTHAELQDQVNWLNSLPHSHKLLVAGNHDSYLDPQSRVRTDEGKHIDWRGVTYLQHSTAHLNFEAKGGRRLDVYGAPQIPVCGGKDFAFQYHRQEDKWSNTIPDHTDILITHTPPRYHLDLPHNMGCGWLLKEVWRIQPRVHVFGHVHAGHGMQHVWWDQCQSAYERICSRGERGVLSDLFDVPMWMDSLKMLLFGGQSVIWSRLWGGDDGGSVMVNASLTYLSTGKLGNPPQIVDI